MPKLSEFTPEMSETLSELFADHVKVLLQTSTAQSQQLQQWARLLVESFQGKTLQELLALEQIQSLVLTAIPKAVVVEHINALLPVVHQVIAQKLSGSDAVSDVLCKQTFLQSIKAILADEAVLKRITHTIVYSDLYRHLISEVLLQGIKQFFSEQSFLAKLPGVGSFLKMGKWGMTKVIPNWEDIVDSQAREFLKANLNSSLSFSQSCLMNSFGAEHLTETLEHLWQVLANVKLRALNVWVQSIGSDQIAHWLQAHWAQYVDSSVYDAVSETLVAAILTQVGQWRLDELWQLYGITEQQVIELVAAQWQQLLVVLVEHPQFVATLQASVRSFFLGEAFLTADC